MGKYTYNKCEIYKYISCQSGEPDNTVLYIASINMCNYNLMRLYMLEYCKYKTDNIIELRRNAYNSRGQIIKDRFAVVIHINNTKTIIKDYRRACYDVADMMELFNLNTPHHNLLFPHLILIEDLSNILSQVG